MLSNWGKKECPKNQKSHSMVRIHVIEIEGLRDLKIKMDTNREVQGVGMNTKLEHRLLGRCQGPDKLRCWGNLCINNIS